MCTFLSRPVRELYCSNGMSYQIDEYSVSGQMTKLKLELYDVTLT